MKQLLLSAAFLYLPLAAHGQAIETGQLGAAQAYDAGVIDIRTGGLDPALWQGTSAKTATHLFGKLPLSSDNALIRDLIEAVILSAGVPPEGADSAYDQARLKTVMALGDKAALDNLAARNPEVTRDSAVRTELALAGGDIPAACQIADNITEGRGTPHWAKLRAFCHIERGELSAAELTTDLLKNSGYQDEAFFGLMRVLTGVSKKVPALPNKTDALLNVMIQKTGGDKEVLSLDTALNDLENPEDRLAALFQFADQLSDDQIAAVFSSLAYDVNDLEGPSSFDLASASANPAPRGTAQLFQLAKASGDARSSARAMGLVLKRADSAGAFSRFAGLFETDMQIIPPHLQAEANLNLFARAAIERGDIGTLQGFYRALPEGPLQTRIALVADALGNGFTLGTLGKDIEFRLGGKGAQKRRAVRDTFIAAAMGSRLSGEASTILEGVGKGRGRSIKPGDLLSLKAAAKASSRAETALRAAIMLDGPALDDASLAAVIEALQIAGLEQFAGRIAAEDFLADL